MAERKARWLWYPGDLELYHALKQNFSRVERGCGWPAFWKSEGFRQRVAFRRVYELTEPTRFRVAVTPGAVGCVDLDGARYPLDAEIPCGAGTHRISIHVGCIACVPAVFVSGGVICSDEGWQVEDYAEPPVPAAFNRYFTDPGQDVSEWPRVETLREPTQAEPVEGGTLFTFPEEFSAALEVETADGSRPMVYLGESRAETLDTANCYYFARPDARGRLPRQALRWAFVPGLTPERVRVRAVEQRVDIPVRARFACDDGELNRIFEVAARTHMLCSDVFFLDGIKRDKWIWSGDAYQSLFVNRYLTGDREIEQRTLTALRGNDPVTTHINTIVDYSLLWILAMGVHTDSYGDMDFLRRMWPKMVSLMDLLRAQRDEQGFLVGRKQDWVFVDWADFDRDGPLCAEQMYLAAAYGTMARFAPEGERTFWLAERERLMAAVERCFWDAEQGAYVDSFTSGRRHVTRHASILAIVFGLVGEARQRLLAERVLHNPATPAIKTPYFRFFELDALCRLGELRTVLDEIKAYWGGMLRLGATTFWEEFDPALPLEKQYAMYGDPYGKSLCHAWAASPIYLLGRYFAGLRAEPGAPEGYIAAPAEGFFTRLDCEFPWRERQVTIRLGAE